jgi:hypothetical protein
MVKSEHRNALLEKYRCINVEYDKWWDCVYADFKEDMREVGICVDRMHFSGFGSQGDGAGFEGSFDNLRTYLDHHHKDQYPMIRKLLASDGYVYVTSRGMYCHANSMVFSIEHDTFYRLIECPTEFQEKIVDAWDRQLEDEASDFEKDVIEQWRSYMQDLYRKLKEEYYYLTSDEAVWEAIVANELDMDGEDLDDAA